ncbi:hypothetical protein HMPREF1199_00636 [Hoylesella oralis CC98A]|nr:hypothetical protein HMPREF1199_00636 [Hoylesella oralis CC98A]
MENLAKQYFEGSIRREDEHVLLEFVEQSDANRELFRQWGDLWAKIHIADADTQKAWHAIEKHIDKTKETAHMHRGGMTKKWRIAVAAASVVALIALSSVLTLKFADMTTAESFYTCEAPMGSRSQVTLPDGSRIWLNAGSTLRYSTLFNNKHREVELQGEAYFEVAKHDGIEFTVKTKGYDVVVKGTKFDVSAYSNDRLVTTELLEGSVAIHAEAGELVMKPGETVTLDKQSGELTKSVSKRNTSAWIVDATEYDNITLADLAKVLSRKYDVNIQIESARLRSERFAVSLHNGETIEEVLSGLQKTAPIRVSRHGKDIRLR